MRAYFPVNCLLMMRKVRRCGTAADLSSCCCCCCLLPLWQALKSRGQVVAAVAAVVAVAVEVELNFEAAAAVVLQLESAPSAGQ